LKNLSSLNCTADVKDGKWNCQDYEYFVAIYGARSMQKTLDFNIKFFLCCTIKLLLDYDVSWGRVFETMQGFRMASIYTEINSTIFDF
jgi:hypothetical protein